MYIRTSLLLVLLCLILASISAGQNPGSERRTFNLPQTEAMNLPLNDAVLIDNTLYISGRGGVDLATMTVPEDPREEAKLLMEDYKAILALADMSMDDLVYVTVYCPDLALYQAFNDVYEDYFEKDFPARAFIGSGPLIFGIRFEMQGIAAK